MENDESRDEREYVDEPKTGFQKFIRLGRDGEFLCIKLFNVLYLPTCYDMHVYLVFLMEFHYNRNTRVYFV